MCSCGPKTYSLPKSWPVPQLTMPPGSTIIDPPSEFQKSNQFQLGYPSNHFWEIHFNDSQDLAALAAHIESCLKPLSYSEYWEVWPIEGSSRQNSRTYYSPDGLTCVILVKGSSASPAVDSDFLLLVTIFPSPPTRLDKVGGKLSGGEQFFLEPIQ